MPGAKVTKFRNLESPCCNLLIDLFFGSNDSADYVLTRNWEDDCYMPQYRLANHSLATEEETKLSKEVLLAANYHLHPNLFKGEGYANITLQENESGTVRLYSVDGKVAYEYKVIAGRNELNIGNANLEGGVYIYRVFIEDELKHTGKIVNVK